MSQNLNNNGRNGLRLFTFSLGALALMALLSSPVRATIVSLDNGNSTSEISTQVSDGGTLGVRSWVVNETNHLTQQWFGYRVASETHENAIGASAELLQVGVPTLLDLDGDTAADDLMSVTYRDAETASTPEKFSINIVLGLTGGMVGADNSVMNETITISNNGSSPLTITFFQYVNFDLLGTAGGDTVLMNGTPINTARQSEGSAALAETVVSQPASHWQVGTPTGLLGALFDGDVDNLSDFDGPLSGADVAWAFQWDLTIPVGSSRVIGKVKNIEVIPGNIVPEPSAFALAGLGLIGLAGATRRRRARA